MEKRSSGSITALFDVEARDPRDEILGSLERGAWTLLTEPLTKADASGAWLRDPDGTAVQLLEGAQAPARPVAEVLINAGSSRQRVGTAAWREVTADVQPRRLGHSLLFTAQPGALTDFYTRVLGLHVSDTIHHDFVTFLNAGPGDHHIFGFISSTHPGFHHASFEVPSIDAIAIGGGQDALAAGATPASSGAPHDRGRTSSTTTLTRAVAGSSGSPTSTRSTTAGSPETGTYRRTCGARRRRRRSWPTPSRGRRKRAARVHDGAFACAEDANAPS